MQYYKPQLGAGNMTGNETPVCSHLRLRFAVLVFVEETKGLKPAAELEVEAACQP